MIINVENSQFYYELFYKISFLFVLLFYLYEAYRRKLPWLTWLMVIVTVRIFFISGTKIGGITSSDFQFLIQNFHLPETGSKNMLGGLIFGIAAIGLSKLLLRIKYPILDAFAVAVPFSMALQRIGCLLVGCCYGNETSFFSGIQYGPNSPAFQHQLISGNIATGDSLSHAVHPVPVYIMIYCILTGILMLNYRNYWKRPGNLALSSLVLLMTGRFIVEFFRSPISNGTFLGANILGLKLVQVISLTVILLLILTIRFREKHYNLSTVEKKENHPLYNSFYFLFIISLLILVRKWFDYNELAVMFMIMIPAAVGIIWQIIKHYPSIQTRISTVSVLILSFVLMGQTIPEEEVKSYKSIKFGFSAGEFETRHNIGTGTGCSRVSQSQYFNQNYNLAGGGYSVTKIKEKESFEYGLNGYFGKQTELGLTSLMEKDIVIAGLNPYVKYDLNWFGVGGGIHLGSLSYGIQNWVQQKPSAMPNTGSLKTPVFPQLSVRVGPSYIFYAKYRLADHFPSPSPGFYQQLEVGSAFGFKNGPDFRFGTDLYNCSYLAATIPIQNKIVIEPLYYWGQNYNSGSTNNSQFSLSFHYRFGHKTERKSIIR